MPIGVSVVGQSLPVVLDILMPVEQVLTKSAVGAQRIEYTLSQSPSRVPLVHDVEEALI
jgi:hypothetical protein